MANEIFDAKKVIDSLVNHNQPPQIIDDDPDGHSVFPENYNWSEQDRVAKVIASLMDHAEEAWPELVNAIDDKRYSITFKIHDYPSNWTVGRICSEIIIDNLIKGFYFHEISAPMIEHGFARWNDFTKHFYSEFGDPDHKELKKWCQDRKNKKLYELQIEACEWAIKRIPKRFTDVQEDIKQKAIEGIETEIAALKKNKKPLRPECFYMWKGAMGEGGGPMHQTSSGIIKK